MKSLALWRQPGFWAVLLAILFLAVSNISHTIALRYVLLAVFLVWTVVERQVLLRTLSSWPVPTLLLGSFLLYALLHSVVLSGWMSISLAEWRSQLLMGGLWFIAGTVLFSRQRPLSILDCVVTAGLLLVAAEVLMAVRYYYQHGVWPYMEVFTTATKLEFTFFVNFAMAFVAVLAGFGKGRTRFPLWSLLAIGALMFFASFHAGARNGLIGLSYLVLSFTLIYVLTHRQHLSRTRLLVLLLLVGVGMAGFVSKAVQKDARNQIFLQSATIAWQDRDGLGWLRMGPYPKLDDGREVDVSAYERVAWIRAGLDLVAERPMGYGYDRRAFTQALFAVGKPNQIGHSHSGFIDLGVGLGVPGVLLWLSFCLSLIVIGFKAFVLRRDVAGLALMLVTCGFLGRMVLESVSKDHMLHIFLFTVAALLAWMHQNPADKSHV
ncbi:O-antigen ligase [Vogesella sp. XCS3]|uniref:O-antigen ligase family protein n=1 Tax=Vogesella sp. XCS3 TaxID=2877939 RepID=UPI001D0B2F5F|nr:O-antigen ligase family protein [Vogesella sp. XCS3]UDM16537.1 O-antigen ligase family protein [Vogesella sp. XCS3]